MSETIAKLRAHLSDAGYGTGSLSTLAGEVTTFENESILGFVLHYDDPATLIANWRRDSDHVLHAAQFALRRAETKAWNAYFLYLADVAGDYGQNVTLGAIEEDLIGTRKIARAGVLASEELRAALLSLLPIQNSPRLESVDMRAEIRLRTSELPPELVEAFLSGVPDATLSQILESAQ